MCVGVPEGHRSVIGCIHGQGVLRDDHDISVSVCRAGQTTPSQNTLGIQPTLIRFTLEGESTKH